MPTVDVSNLIRKAGVFLIKALGSPFSLYVVFCVSISAIGAMIIQMFNIPFPNLNSLTLPAGFTVELPILDVICFIVNVSMFVTMYNYFIQVVNAFIPFIGLFSVAYFGALLVYRNSLALRNQIRDYLVN
jgi:hypothetical protein